MKMINKAGAFLAALGLTVAASQASSVGVGCLTLLYPGSAGVPSYLDANVTFTAGGFGDGIYDAVCANINRDADVGVPYSFTAFDINDPLVPGLGLVVDPSSIDKVEYLLNQNYPGRTSSGDGVFTADDVQVAVWSLLDGPGSLSANHSALNFSQIRLQEILDEANLNGVGFEPTCGQLKAYILNPVAPGCVAIPNPDAALPVFQNVIVGVPAYCPPPPLEDPVGLACVAAETGAVGAPYSSSLIATGGTAPYMFTLTSGALPGGLTLNTNTGVISGIPTAPGAFDFSAKVVDSVGSTGLHTASVTCRVTVTPPQLDLACVATTTGKVGTPYSSALVATGGVAPYTFAIVGGALPDGLSLNLTTGAITGTPTVAGTFNFTAKVTDTVSAGTTRTDSVECSIVITPKCVPLALQCVSQGTGVVGQFYTANFPVTGGQAPYTFSKIYGYFPSGLTLNPSTGVLSGTPTTAGTYSFTVKVVDSSLYACGYNQYTTVCCTVTIKSSCPPITLACVSTTTGKVGTAYSASLSVSGGVAPYTFSIVSGSLPPGLSVNASSGLISGTPTSAGTFNFTAKVSSANASQCGCYGYDTVCCSIKIDPAPTGCQSLVCGDTATIGYWNNCNGQALIKSLNGGSNSKLLANWLASNYPYLWGANAGSKNLTGKRNCDVAALFQSLFNVCGQKTEAQMLAVALAIYVTDSDLAGTTARSSGFNVSTSGTGAKCFNVGCYGSSIGLTSNQNYTVAALLAQANAKKKAGSFNANAFNSIFDGINVKGDRR